jgi:WD40 repeat protein
VVTGGSDDATLYLHSGPPFTRVIGDQVAEKVHERGSINKVRYNRHVGTVLCSVGTDGNVVFYEGKQMCLIKKVEGVHSSSVFGCAWNKSGEYVLTCGADGYARLLDGRVHNDNETLGKVLCEWNVAEILVSTQSCGEGKRDKVPMGAMQLGCAFIKGDVPVSVGYNGLIVVLPLPSSLNHLPFDTKLEEPFVITGHQAPISAMTFGAPGTNTIYTADTDGIIIEWNGSTGVANGRVVASNHGEDDDDDLMGKVHNGAITSLAFEGETLYSCGWDDCVRITKDRLCSSHNNDDELKLESQPNAMARGGSLIVVMTVDGLLFIRDKLIVSELVRLPYTATAVCLSKDDTMLFVGGDDCNIHVYSVESSLAANSSPGKANPLTESHVIQGGHLKPVQSLSLSHDGTMLAAADVRDVCIYSTSDYSNIVSKGRWCFHTQRIGCLAWSPDDTVLASGGNDDDIFLWCIAKKMKRIHYRFAHRGGVTGLRFVGDAVSGGEGDWMLVSTGYDGCLNWWNVEEDVKSKFK